MTDDTRPTEGDTADRHPAPVSPPVSGQTDAEQHPEPSPSGEAPVPPYAAHLPPGAGAYAGSAAAYAGSTAPYAGSAPGAYAGGPRQEYPGAPPTWGSSAGAAPVTTPKAPVLGILALVLAIFGVLLLLVPFFGPLFSWVFLLSALVLAIVTLARRGPGKSMAIWALVLSLVAGLTSGTGAVGAILVGSIFAGNAADPDEYDAPAPDASYPVEENTLSPTLIAPDYPSMGNPRAEPIALGTTLTLAAADASGADESPSGSWTFTVKPMEDVTASAAAADVVAPKNGALLAVPIEMTNLTGEPVDLSVAFNAAPSSWLVTADGGTAESAYLSPVDYPTSWDVDIVQPGATTTFYQVYDVAPTVATTGLVVTLLSSGQTLHWRAAA